MQTAAPQSSQLSVLHPSWVVIVAGVSGALHVGKLPPALPVLQQALGISLVEAGFLISMVQLAGMTLGLVVGLSADGLGLRRSLLTGLALLSAASFAGGFADSVGSLLLLRALEGLGFLLVVMPAPALIRRTVDARHLHGRMGWWSTYMPIGSAAALLLGPPFIAATNWMAWWWALGAISAAAGVWAWRGVPPDPRSTRQPTKSAPLAASPWLQRLRLTLRSPGPWLVALSFAVYSSQWIAVIGFLPTVYAQAGVSAAQVGLLTGLVALANVLGNVMSGRLLQRGWPARRSLQLGFAAMALGALGAFVQWDALGLPLRFASVLVFSAVGGVIPGTLFSLGVRLAPSEGTVSTTVGFMQQCSASGQFLGPPVVAWLAAWAGGWQFTWLATGLMCAMGMVLAIYIERLVRSPRAQSATPVADGR